MLYANFVPCVYATIIQPMTIKSRWYEKSFFDRKVKGISKNAFGGF